MKKKIKWALLGLLVLFGLLQLFNPSPVNPPVKSDFIAIMAPPAELAQTLRASCYDCHSHETRWPWYSRIAPISWSIAQDVENGRANLDLSTWTTNDLDHALRKLGAMSDDVQSGDMPVKKYTLIHRDARLTPDQRQKLSAWLDAKQDELRPQNAAH